MNEIKNETLDTILLDTINFKKFYKYCKVPLMVKINT